LLAVDTNILVYAADTASPFYRTCIEWLERQRIRSEAWFTTWPILYEFLRVVTHPRALRRPWTAQAAWHFIDQTLFDAPGFALLEPTQRHRMVASDTLAEMPSLRGNLMHDVHTAVLMREHGIRRICTRDTDFHRFKFLEVLDPVEL
jgi:uncharacterized protein